MPRVVITFAVYKKAVGGTMNHPHVTDVAPTSPTRQVLPILPHVWASCSRAPKYINPTISRVCSELLVFSFESVHFF